MRMTRTGTSHGRDSQHRLQRASEMPNLGMSVCMHACMQRIDESPRLTYTAARRPWARRALRIWTCLARKARIMLHPCCPPAPAPLTHGESEAGSPPPRHSSFMRHGVAAAIRNMSGARIARQGLFFFAWFEPPLLPGPHDCGGSVVVIVTGAPRQKLALGRTRGCCRRLGPRGYDTVGHLHATGANIERRARTETDTRWVSMAGIRSAEAGD